MDENTAPWASHKITFKMPCYTGIDSAFDEKQEGGNKVDQVSKSSHGQMVSDELLNLVSAAYELRDLMGVKYSDITFSRSVEVSEEEDNLKPNLPKFLSGMQSSIREIHHVFQDMKDFMDRSAL